MYRAGASLKDLAAEFGVTRSAIRNQLVKAGVEMHRNSREPLKHVDTQEVLYLREVAGLTWREIGEHVGMSKPGAKSRYLAGVRDRAIAQRSEGSPGPGSRTR